MDKTVLSILFTHTVCTHNTVLPAIIILARGRTCQAPSQSNKSAYAYSPIVLLQSNIYHTNFMSREVSLLRILELFLDFFFKKKKKTLKKRKKTPDIDNSYAQLVTLYYQDDEQSKGTGGSVLGTTDMWKADSRLYNLCWGHMLCDFSTAVLFSCKGLVPDGSGRLLVSICLPNITGFGGAKLEALLQSKHIWAPQYVASLPVPRQASV